MKYILVRHVETKGNVEHCFNGVTESPYTPRGEAMKTVLINTLCGIHKKMPIDQIYSSPILRAKDIGEAVANRLDCPLNVEPDLAEFNFGIFDGLTAEAAQKKNPEVWAEWMADYNRYTLPDGDSGEAYHARLGQFLKCHARDHANQTVLIVAHGGTVQGLMLHLLDLPMESKWHFKIGLGGIVILDCPEGYGILEALYTPDDYDKI